MLAGRLFHFFLCVLLIRCLCLPPVTYFLFHFSAVIYQTSPSITLGVKFNSYSSYRLLRFVFATVSFSPCWSPPKPLSLRLPYTFRCLLSDIRLGFVLYILIWPSSKYEGNQTNSLRVITFSSVCLKRKYYSRKQR